MYQKPALLDKDKDIVCCSAYAFPSYFYSCLFARDSASEDFPRATENNQGQKSTQNSTFDMIHRLVTFLKLEGGSSSTKLPQKQYPSLACSRTYVGLAKSHRASPKQGDEKWPRRLFSFLSSNKLWALHKYPRVM